MKQNKTGKETLLSMLSFPRLRTKTTQAALDLLILGYAFGMAYLLRFDFAIPDGWRHLLAIQLPLVVLIQFSALSLARGRSFIWRYTGTTHLKGFFYAAAASFIFIGILRLSLPEQLHVWRVPLSVNIIDTVLAFGGTLGMRVFRRSLFERYEKHKWQKLIPGAGALKKPVLLIGAGHAGVIVAREIERRADVDLEIKGFVDDDPGKQKRSVVGDIKVLGTMQSLPRLVHDLKIDHVVITIAQASGQDIRRIVETCERIPVKVRIIPGLYEILQGRVEVSRIRDVQIEDLLGREPIQLDEDSLARFLEGKTVMVTGAGGSIGSELVRQVARFAPAHLLLVERAEFGLFNIERELRASESPGSDSPLSLIPLVADVCDEGRMQTIFKKYRPHIVLHAAAHKHVPLMERNPGEAVKNNVLGTFQLGNLAGKFGAEVFVLVSTDKAVSPASVMGATKRVAELVIQDLNLRSQTRFVAVRFGNVIGSAGSVIPIFQEQIRKGGPVTITDKRMKRYFMTIPEASQLVLQAGAIGSQGEGGEVFILKMGEPVLILDLAESIITLSGFKPHEEIKIVETGKRPGEKLYEDLTIKEEDVAKTEHPKIFICRIAARETEDIKRALEQLRELSKNGHEQELCAFLNELLPEARLDSLTKRALPMGVPLS